MISKTLSMIDTSDAKEVRKYEDLLRKRFKSYGYRLQRGKTINPDDPHMQLKRIPVQRGFKIIDMTTGAVVEGEDFGLSIEEIENFWMGKLRERQIEQQKIQHEKYCKRESKKLFGIVR